MKDGESVGPTDFTALAVHEPREAIRASVDLAATLRNACPCWPGFVQIILFDLGAMPPRKSSNLFSGTCDRLIEHPADPPLQGPGLIHGVARQ